MVVLLFRPCADKSGVATYRLCLHRHITTFTVRLVAGLGILEEKLVAGRVRDMGLAIVLCRIMVLTMQAETACGLSGFDNYVLPV